MLAIWDHGISEARMAFSVLQYPKRLLLALVGAVGVFLCAMGSYRISVLFSILIAAAYFLLLVIVRSDYKLRSAGDYVALAFASFLVASCFAFGEPLEAFGRTGCINIVTVPFLSVAFFAMAFAVLKIGRFFLTKSRFVLGRKSCSASLAWSLVLAIWVAWVVWYLTLFPGVYGYDGGFFYLEWDNPNTPVVSHYSVLYTWLYYEVIHIGKCAFGSVQLGFALFAALQMALVLYSVSRVVLFLYKDDYSAIVVIAAGVYFVVCPWLPILSVSSAQDAVFMAMFVLALLNAIELLRCRSGARLAAIRLVLCLVVFSLVRNNGIIVIAFSLLLSVFLLRGESRRLRAGVALCLIVPILLTLVVQGPIYSLLNVQSSQSIRELLSVPVMQLSRVHESSMLAEERSAIEEYLDSEGMALYSLEPEISDVMKGGLDVERVKDDPARFLYEYVRIGVAHPKKYLDAFGMLNLGLWYPFKAYPDTRMYHPFIETEDIQGPACNPDYIDIRSASVFPDLDALVNHCFGGCQFGERGEEAFSSLPFSFLIKPGTYTIFLLAATLVFWIRRQKAELFICAFFWGIVLTVAFAPVVLCRYVAPVMIGAPLLFGLLSKPVEGLRAATSRNK